MVMNPMEMRKMINQYGTLDPQMAQIPQTSGPETPNFQQIMMPPNPNITMGDPQQAAMIQPPPPDPAQLSQEAQVVILQTIIKTSTVRGLSAEGGELNLDVFANTINTLATAYKTLKDADNQKQEIPPEIQMEMEQQKLNSQLQAEQARLQIEQQRAAMELQIKQAEADVKLETMRQQAQLKIEQAQLDSQLKAQQAEQDAQIKQQSADLDLATKEDQHLQEMSMREQQQEQQASQSKDKQG